MKEKEQEFGIVNDKKLAITLALIPRMDKWVGAFEPSELISMLNYMPGDFNLNDPKDVIDLSNKWIAYSLAKLTNQIWSELYEKETETE